MAVGVNKKKDVRAYMERSVYKRGSKQSKQNHSFPTVQQRLSSASTETEHFITNNSKDDTFRSPSINKHFLLFLLSLFCALLPLSIKLDFMEETKQQSNGSWLSVPQFGDWDQKGAFPDYSLDFTKIRESRKQNKRDPSRASLGNDEDFINPTAPANAAPINDSHFDQNHSPTTRRSFFSYFNCCVKA